MIRLLLIAAGSNLCFLPGCSHMDSSLFFSISSNSYLRAFALAIYSGQNIHVWQFSLQRSFSSCISPSLYFGHYLDYPVITLCHFTLSLTTPPPHIRNIHIYALFLKCMYVLNLLSKFHDCRHFVILISAITT